MPLVASGGGGWGLHSCNMTCEIWGDGQEA